MRRFVRHPSSIPIELTIERVAPRAAFELLNIGSGGFACAVDQPVAVGSSIHLRIPIIWPEYRGSGVVVWCHSVPPRYEVGIEFGPQDLFKAKMVEQLCQIEQYRQQVWSDEGRELDSEQAAQEWIALYAKEFAEVFETKALK